MKAVTATVPEYLNNTISEQLKSFIIRESDLLFGVSIEERYTARGCDCISKCNCDCNDGC